MYLKNRDVMQIPPSHDKCFNLREWLQPCASTVKAEMLMHVCKEILVAESGAK